jgi:hypothetical protein
MFPNFYYTGDPLLSHSPAVFQMLELDEHASLINLIMLGATGSYLWLEEKYSKKYADNPGVAQI